MIPQRMLSHEIGGNGLKERVTACRKRLRVNRVTHRAHRLNEAVDLFPETAPAVSEFHICTTDIPGMQPAMVRKHYSSAREGSELKDSVTLQLTEEQEVGSR